MMNQKVLLLRNKTEISVMLMFIDFEMVFVVFEVRLIDECLMPLL